MPTLYESCTYAAWDIQRQAAKARVKARYPALREGSRDYENALDYQLRKRR